MPKKKDGPDAKKSRKSSSTSKDATSSSPSGADIVPPPNPTATHLIASNPFDDPPANQMKVGPGGMMHNFPGQSMVRIPGPSGAMGPGFPGWNPRGGMRPPYNGPGTPGWNPSMHGNNGMGPHPGYHPSLPPNPNMGNNGYGMNRAHYAGPGMPQYRGSPRMSVNNVRPNMGPLGSPDGPENMMHDPQNMGPNHMVPSGNHGHMLQNTGQMKALTRPTTQMSSPTAASSRKGSTGSSKADSSKSPKNTEGSTKSRKKSDKKLSHDNKSKSADNEKLPPGADQSGVAPHSVPPSLPQLCKRCKNSINSPAEDAIRCLASCNMWYHRACVGLTEDAFNFLKSEELALWACDLCLQTKEIHSVRTRVPMADGQLTSA